MKIRFLVLFWGCAALAWPGFSSASPLDDAIQKEDVAAVRQLVEQGANLEATDGAGQTPLHHAVAVGNLDIMLILIGHHANVTVADNDGNKPMHIAAAKGRPQAVKLLHAQGAQINEPNKEGLTPPHLAAREGRAAALEALLEAGADVNGLDQAGNAPLHYAAAQGQRKAVEMLLAHNAAAGIWNQAGQTPLTMAVANGRTGVAEMLLEAGAATENAQTEDYEEQGMPPQPDLLTLALGTGRKDLVSLMIKHGVAVQAEHLYVTKPDKPMQVTCEQDHNPAYQIIVKPGKNDAPAAIGGSAFAKAIMCHDKQLLATLMRRAKEMPYFEIAANLPGYSGTGQHPDTGLFNLVFKGDPEMGMHASSLFSAYAHRQLQDQVDNYEFLKFLLQKGASPNWTEAGGSSLYAAAEAGDMKMAKFLVEHGASAKPGENGGGSPLAAAVLAGKFEMANYLLKNGADVNEGTGSETMLHSAAEMGNLDMVKFLIAHGAHPDVTSGAGNTPLHRAVLAGNPAVVKYLLEHGADPDAANMMGNTPLHFAAARNMREISVLLIRKGADVNAANKAGNTPLHQAVRFPGKFDTALLMLKNGADPNAANNSGFTALHCAALRDHQSGDMQNRQGGALRDVYICQEEPGDYYYQVLTEEQAADADLADLIKDLIKHKADVGAKDGKGRTPHDLALENKVHAGLAAYLELPKPKAQTGPAHAKKKQG